jgi:predicted hydrocarbon binding protein
MATTTTRQTELALPAAALGALRNALTASVGAEAAADALRAAGHAAGDAFYRILAAGDDDAVAGLGADRFWARLALLFSARGWGQLSFDEAHPGVGSLHATDWAEAAGDGDAAAASCHLTTGLLANLLGQVAGSEVAVLEVECRARGDQRCRFLFGGTEAVYAVYDRLSAGDAPDAALARIG